MGNFLEIQIMEDKLKEKIEFLKTNHLWKAEPVHLPSLKDTTPWQFSRWVLLYIQAPDKSFTVSKRRKGKKSSQITPELVQPW